MSRFRGNSCMVLTLVAVYTAGWDVAASAALEVEIPLKDGRVLRGKLAPLDSLSDQPRAADPDGVGPVQRILCLNDGLRRTFVSKRQIQPGAGIRQADAGQVEEKFTIRQRVLRQGRRVTIVGAVIRVTPFDEFGHRIFEMNSARGPVSVVQGITEITPRWTRIEGISHLWGSSGMRVATSSIPRDVLHKILMKQIDPKNIEHRKRVATFYLHSERYADARKQLEAILAASADQPDVREDLAPTILALRQLQAQQLLDELQLRRRAGQHRLVLSRLQAFPSEGIAGEKLQEVREVIQEYETLEARRKEIGKQFDRLLAEIADPATRKQIEPVRYEIFAELSLNTLGRMTAFRQSADDPDLSPGEKLSLAVSGWLLGSDAATVRLPVSLSLYRVRELVRQYLSEPAKLNRARIFGQLGSEEGAVPGLVAELLAAMKPPVDPPEPVSAEKPGLYELEVAGPAKEESVHYVIQLPPEYDPYRRYPTILTLHGAGTTASQQIDWWAGAWTKESWRSGQASRQGYIVIAPRWAGEHQKQYDYSVDEYAAVLGSLRDACRRFAVDTDRVFLTGHSMGGDAAWDLGLAHPDLWAGVIPIVAQANRYCTLYWPNARYVPFYVVCGELDGGKFSRNAGTLDRYLQLGFNATVVEYLGRGHEHFYDEILRLFDWMGRLRRDFFPREFTCSTMRPWDNYFWWIGLEGLPPKSMVDPADWPIPRGTRAMPVVAKITANNGIHVRAGAAGVSVWLSPQMLDFERRIHVTVNTRRLSNLQLFEKYDTRTMLQTMLEDVHTRGDRQHPFWVKLEMPTGRFRAAR